MSKLVEQLNFRFDVDELKEYVAILKKDYQEYKWGAHILLDSDVSEYTKERVGAATKSYGWAITTENLNESSKANPPWPEAVDDTAYAEKTLRPERKTELVFGITEQIFKIIPYANHMLLSIFPPGNATMPHRDQDFLLRVHVPIYTNKKSRWLTDDGYYYMKEPGTAYLCDTRQMHSVYNDGDTDRVHLIFAIEDSKLEHLKSLSGILTLKDIHGRL